MDPGFANSHPYQRILVAVDNSKHSDAAIKAATLLARHGGGTVVGLHVYAAKLHERRFVQMEPGLPDQYSGPELQRQRSAHESLISKGLRLISESYLERARAICKEDAGVPFEGRLAEGRNFEEIIKQAWTGDYDLVALGVVGLGCRRRSLIGSVCERVVRTVRTDTLVVRNGRRDGRGVMVALDGSANSYQALSQGLALGAALGEPVEVVTVYDPQFHVVAFKRLAHVLSEEAATLFRFREQKRLHTEIIDSGLEKLYRSYLDQAEELAAARGQQIQATVLRGKPFQEVLDYAEECHPRLLVAGRFGQHGSEIADIGSTTENLVRLAPCSVLVVTGWLEASGIRRPVGDDRLRMPWDREAEARLEGVSDFARPIVVRVIEAYARRNGHPRISVEVMAKARSEVGW